MSDNEYDLDMIFSDPSTDLSIDELFSSPNSTTDHQHHDELRSASHNLPSQTAVVHQTEIPFHPPQDPTLLISQPETLHQASYGDQMSFPLPPRPPPNTSPLMEVGSSSSLQLQPDIAMSQTFSHPPPQNPSSLKGYNSSKSVEESLLRTSQVMEHEGMHMINSIGASTLDENPITRIVPHHIMSRLNGLGIFNNLDMEMLMCDRKLAEIACNDPRRAKKLISNRISAKKSKERNKQYLMELEAKFKNLNIEISTGTEQLKSEKEKSKQISMENESLKIQISLKNDQALIKKEINEALKQEVNQLKQLHSQQQGMPAVSNKPDFFKFGEQQQLQILSSILSTLQSQNIEHAADGVDKSDEKQLPDI